MANHCTASDVLELVKDAIEAGTSLTLSESPASGPRVTVGEVFWLDLQTAPSESGPGTRDTTGLRGTGRVPVRVIATLKVTYAINIIPNDQFVSQKAMHDLEDGPANIRKAMGLRLGAEGQVEVQWVPGGDNRIDGEVWKNDIFFTVTYLWDRRQ